MRKHIIVLRPFLSDSFGYPFYYGDHSGIPYYFGSVFLSIYLYL